MKTAQFCVKDKDSGKSVKVFDVRTRTGSVGTRVYAAKRQLDEYKTLCEKSEKITDFN